MEGVRHGCDGLLSLIQMTGESGSYDRVTVFLYNITVLGVPRLRRVVFAGLFVRMRVCKNSKLK